MVPELQPDCVSDADITPVHIIYDHLIITCSFMAKICRIPALFKIIIHMIYMQYNRNPSTKASKSRRKNKATEIYIIVIYFKKRILQLSKKFPEESLSNFNLKNITALVFYITKMLILKFYQLFYILLPKNVRIQMYTFYENISHTSF